MNIDDKYAVDVFLSKEVIQNIGILKELAR